MATTTTSSSAPIPAAAGASQQRTLSAEQHAFVSKRLEPGEIVHVSARAGSGKTTTLVEYARAHPKQRLLYVVYNADARAEAEKRMPRNCVPRTFHSIALQCVNAYRASEGLATVSPASYVNKQAFNALMARIKAPRNVQAPALVLFNKFLGSTARLCSEECASEWIDEEKTLAAKSLRLSDAPALAAAVTAAWRAMVRQGDPAERDAAGDGLQMTFSGCAKLAYLQAETPAGRAPVKDFDAVLVDESQDFVEQYLHTVLAWRPLPIAFVGDPAQRIYGWQGTTDVFAHAAAKPTRTNELTQSFRFAPEVAALAHKITQLPIEGVARWPTRVRVQSVQRALGPSPDLLGMGSIAYLHRTNMAMLLHAARIVEQAPATRRVHIIGRGGEVLKKVRDLIALFRDSTQQWLFNLKEQEAMRQGDSDTLEIFKMIRKDSVGLARIVSSLETSTVRAGAACHAELGTVHAAKGLEWDVVVLGDDLAPKEAMTARELETLKLGYEPPRPAAGPAPIDQATQRRIAAALQAASTSVSAAAAAAAVIEREISESRKRPREEIDDGDDDDRRGFGTSGAEASEDECDSKGKRRRIEHKKLADTEAFRLLYVALTRARKLLVLSPLVERVIERRGAAAEAGEWV